MFHNPMMFKNAAPTTDPNTLLLMHFDGANDSVIFTDSSQYNRPLTRNGTPTVSTAQSKFGGASGLFDAAGEYVTTGVQSSFDFGSGNFTIECFTYFNSATGYVLGNGTSGFIAGSFVFGYIPGLGGFGVVWNSGASNLSGSMTISQWEHWCYERSSSTVRLYKNGAIVGSTTSSANLNLNLNNNTFIARTGWDNTTPNFYIDEFRISNIARYNGAFTPPTAPFNP